MQTSLCQAYLLFMTMEGINILVKEKLPGQKIIRNPLITAHQKEYYSGLAWANELAKKGYVVLVPDAFSFASRRVMLQDVPKSLRQGLSDEDPENPANIASL